MSDLAGIISSGEDGEWPWLGSTTSGRTLRLTVPVLSGPVRVLLGFILIGVRAVPGRGRLVSGVLLRTPGSSSVHGPPLDARTVHTVTSGLERVNRETRQGPNGETMTTIIGERPTGTLDPDRGTWPRWATIARDEDTRITAYLGWGVTDEVRLSGRAAEKLAGTIAERLIEGPAS